MKAVNKVVRGLTAVELVACALTFAIMVICYFISVVNRNIIKGSMPWTEELAVYSMVYMALLGTELGLRDGTQISIKGLVNKLPLTARHLVGILTQCIIIVFSALMCNSGWKMVLKQTRIGQTSPGLGIPMGVPYFALVLGFGLITIIQFAMLIQMIRNFKVDELASAEKEGEK